VPGLGPGQQVRHGALRQAQDTLPKQPLPWGQGTRAACHPGWAEKPAPFQKQARCESSGHLHQRRGGQRLRDPHRGEG
jgi:hypothetical protein